MQTNESAETVKTSVAVLTAKCCQLTYSSRFYVLLSPETGSRSCFRNVFHGASTFLAREKERESSRELDQERWLERTKVRESDIYYIIYSDKISEANEGARETRRERERDSNTAAPSMDCLYGNSEFIGFIHESCKYSKPSIEIERARRCSFTQLILHVYLENQVAGREQSTLPPTRLKLSCANWRIKLLTENTVIAFFRSAINS